MLPDGRSVVNLTAHMAVTVCVAVRSVQTAAAFTLTTTVAAVIVVAAAAATAADTGVTGPSLLCHLAVCLVLQLVLCQALAEASNLLFLASCGLFRALFELVSQEFLRPTQRRSTPRESRSQALPGGLVVEGWFLFMRRHG